MNRLPRRPPRQTLPLRGRMAALSDCSTRYASLRQTCSSTAGSYRSAPVRLRRGRKRPHRHKELGSVYDLLAKLYSQWPGLFHLLNRPWKWLMLLVIIILLLSVMGRLT